MNIKLLVFLENQYPLEDQRNCALSDIDSFAFFYFILGDYGGEDLWQTGKKHIKGVQEYLQNKINFTEPGWNHK